MNGFQQMSEVVECSVTAPHRSWRIILDHCAKSTKRTLVKRSVWQRDEELVSDEQKCSKQHGDKLWRQQTRLVLKVLLSHQAYRYMIILCLLRLRECIELNKSERLYVSDDYADLVGENASHYKLCSILCRL